MERLCNVVERGIRIRLTPPRHGTDPVQCTRRASVAPNLKKVPYNQLTIGRFLSLVNGEGRSRPCRSASFLLTPYTLKLSRVHWVRPEVVVEVTYLTWTDDNLAPAGVVSGTARRQAGEAGGEACAASASTTGQVPRFVGPLAPAPMRRPADRGKAQPIATNCSLSL
jgi:hypothetical protein